MNYRIVLFSAIMTAMAGAVISLAALQIGIKDFNQFKYQSQSYRDLRKHYVHIGIVLGFTLGAGLECVRQMKSKKD